MPLYEYRCEDCSRRFVVRRPVDHRDEALSCPQCGGRKVGRLVSSFIAFGATSDGQVKALGGNSCASCPLTNCSACILPRR